MRDQLGNRLPTFTEDEFVLLREAELDFYGMNYYTSQFARHSTSIPADTDFFGNVNQCAEDKDGRLVGKPSGIYWLHSVPNGFRSHLVRIYKKYQKPIYVTENGCPCPGEDKTSREESVNDTYRQQYFSDHLDATVGAIKDGAKIGGYFAWSLLDNLGGATELFSKMYRLLTLCLEWSDGYGPRFGCTYTDFETLERTPKDSALKLRAMIENRMIASDNNKH